MPETREFPIAPQEDEIRLKSGKLMFQVPWMIFLRCFWPTVILSARTAILKRET